MRTLFTALTLLAVMARTSRAQAAPMSRADALAQAGMFIEGPGSQSQKALARILADSGALQLYDDLLNGRQSWVVGVDSATILRYLALSENPRFLPTFLRFADPSLPIQKHDVFVFASVGLTRLAALPAARERLLALGQPSVRPKYREAVVQVLTFRNSVAARDVLRSMTMDDLPPAIRQRAATALAAPAAP